MSLSEADKNRFWTREEYRAWCEQQPRGRFERIDGRIVRMAAERGAHLRVKAATFLALRRAVAAAGVPCQALPNGATVETGENDYEPDALVNCGDPMADDAIAAPNPVVVVEVVSPGTESVDTSRKLQGYFEVPSIAHYLIVHPIRRFVIHHRRVGEEIATRILKNGPVAMHPPGLTITVEELWEE